MTAPSSWGAVRTVALRFALGLLSAGLLGAYAWYPGLALLPYVAIVPWVWLYTDDRSPRVSALYFVLTSWVAFMAQCPQPFKLTWYAAPAIALPPSVPWWLFAPVLGRIHRRFDLPRALTVPLVWVSVEWVRATYGVGHFDLYPLGYSQARFTPLVQIADVTGVYGVSFLVAAVNGLFADALFALRDGGWSRSALATPRLARSSVALALAFLVSVAYGGVRLSMSSDAEGPRVALVQPCTSHKPGNALGDHLTQLLLTERQVPAGAADLIVWPENAILDNIRRDGIYLDDLAWVTRSKGTYLLTGGMNWPLDRPGKKMNGAFLVDPSGRIVGQYNKQALFPFTEYVPADDFLARTAPSFQKWYRVLIRKAWGAAARAVPGDRMVLLHLPWKDGDIAFAVLICSENMYPPIAAEAGRLGARFLVNITSEGNMGGPVQEQMMRISALRAIENRISYVRVGNTGVSGIIDAAGRVRATLTGEHGQAVLDPGVLIAEVPLGNAGRTLYLRSHDAFVKLCVAATAILLLLTFAFRRRAAIAATLAAVAAMATVGCGAAPGSGPISSAAAAAAAERGRALYERGRPAAALPELIRACNDPSACRSVIVLAEECFKDTKQIESGIDFLGRIAARFPEVAAVAKGSRGVLLDRVGEVIEAESEYRASLAIAPSARVAELLAELLQKREDFEGAVQAARVGIAADPDDPGLGALLARCLRRAGRLDEARRVLDAAAAAHKDSAAVWTEMGRLDLAVGNLAGAEAALTTSITADPVPIEPRFLLARIALRAGRTEEAKQRLEEIEKIQAAAAAP